MSLDQIAQKLKSARDVAGLSLAQIQEKTKIPYNHLASIDAANLTTYQNRYTSPVLSDDMLNVLAWIPKS